MLGASNMRQQRRLWALLDRPDMIKRTNDERDADHDREIAVLDRDHATRTADEWEDFLQARHVPAARVRTMGEALADPQIDRGVVHATTAATASRRLRRAARRVQIRPRRPEHRHAAAGARPAQRGDFGGAGRSRRDARSRYLTGRRRRQRPRDGHAYRSMLFG